MTVPPTKAKVASLRTCAEACEAPTVTRSDPETRANAGSERAPWARKRGYASVIAFAIPIVVLEEIYGGLDVLLYEGLERLALVRFTRIE